MGSSDTDFKTDEGKSVSGIVSLLFKNILKLMLESVLKKIPVTLFAIFLGAVLGGVFGLAVLPLAPFFALGGALLLGLPMAVWEYWLLNDGETAWDHLS